MYSKIRSVKCHDGPVYTDWNGVIAELFDIESTYLGDSPSQDSSSGIASDDHNTASALSGSSPTYDVIERGVITTRLTPKYRDRPHHGRKQHGYAHRDSPQHSGYESDYVDLAELARREDADTRRRRTYRETNLDDPESDCTFVFPDCGVRTRNCDSAPPTRYPGGAIPDLSINKCQNTVHNIALDHLRTNGDMIGVTSPAPHELVCSRSANGRILKRPKVCYFDIIPDDVIIRIFRHLPSDQLCRNARVCLRWYNLSWDPILWTTIRINDSTVDADQALRILTRRLSYETPGVCAIVEKIHLGGCELLTDRGLYTIARLCPDLRHLDLRGCVNISNIALFEVVSNCVNLEHLNVAGCPRITCICLTPEATVQAATYGKQIYLHYLDMTDCYNLDDAGLQIIASHCSKLTHLYLRRCPKVSDVGLQHVANHCGSLREFSINDCRGVTDFGLRELAKLGSNLRYLSAAKCEKVSDVGVQFVARACARLRYLNVRGCEAVSDDSLDALARCCPRLRSVDVGRCDVTDAGLETLARHCRRLRKVSVKACDAVTDGGIVRLAAHCRDLRQLNIQDCSVTIEAYRAVKRHCKHCVIEHTNPAFY